MELVSIGIPAYNGETYIKNSIQSLLSQTYPHFKLIISDDNSADDTAKICQEFTKKDRRIIFFQQKKQLGFARNFNFVLQKARAPYFLWAGQDDFWDRNYVKILVELLESNPDAVSAVANYQNVFEGKKYTIMKHTFAHSYLLHFHSLLHFIQTTNLSYFYGLHKTDALKKIGGYQIDSRPFFKSSDYLTIFRILLEGRMIFTNKILFYKRDTGNFTRRFELLKNHRFTQDVRSSIFRYISFPVSFLYDAALSIRHAAASRLSNVQKMILIFHIGAFYLKRNFQFIISIFQGLWHILKGALPSSQEFIRR